MYVEDQTLSGFSSKLKKLVKKPIEVAQKVTAKVTPKPLRKFADKPLRFVARQIDKGVALDPGTRLLQSHYGRTKEDRKAKLQRGMTHMDKITGQSKGSKRLMRVLDPSSKILDEIANAERRLRDKGLAPGEGTFFGKARRWVSPASFLHREGGPIRKPPNQAQLVVETPGGAQIVDTGPVMDPFASEVYPVNPDGDYFPPPSDEAFQKTGQYVDDVYNPTEAEMTAQVPEPESKPVSPLIKWGGLALLLNFIF